MPLTLPKQQITGKLGINNISGTVTLPMQSVTGVAVMPLLSGTIGIPAQQVSGEMAMPGLFVDVTIPMQQFSAATESWAIESVLTLPMQRISGLEPEIDAEINMPMQSVVAWLEQPILGIPMQQVAGHAVVPLVITDAPIAIPMQAFPVYQTGDIAGPAPLITGAATAMSGYWMDGDAPTMTGAATALTGSVASMSGRMVLPVSGIAVDSPSTLAGVAPLAQSSISASATTLVRMSGSIPVAESSISGSSGAIASIDSVFAKPKSDIGVYATNECSLSSVLKAVSSSIDSTVTTVAHIASSSPSIQSAIAATSGTAIAVTSDAPLIAASSIAADSFATASMSGAPEPIRSAMGASTGVALSIDSVMPSGAASAMQIWVRPEVSMAGVAHVVRSSIQTRAIAQAVKILAMNLKLGAVTEFQSAIEFESVAALDGVVYVAGPDGVYAMSGADDDGDAFTQSALFGMLDYGSSQKKHPDSVLIEASASAAPVVTVHVGATSNAYASVGPKRDGMYRAKVGRGLTGKRMQFEVSGAGIQSVSSVDVLVEPGKRAF